MIDENKVLEALKTIIKFCDERDERGESCEKCPFYFEDVKECFFVVDRYPPITWERYY